MVKKISAQNQDIRRTIQKEKKRFIAIMIITVLGVMMFSGLKAGCVDLRKSADRFFDEQNLHDLYIQSTLGLTDDDVAALQSIQDIESVEGIYSEEVQMNKDDQTVRITLETLTTTDIDLPYITEGRMPHEDNEVLATDKFLYDTGLKVGDTFTIEEDLEEDEEPTFAITEYVITGSATDVRDINNPFGSVSFRNTPGTDVVFITRDAVNSDIYTGVSLTISGTSELFCFSDEYDEIVSELETIIDEEVKTQREEARTKEVYDQAEEAIADAEAEVNDQLNDALHQLEDAQKQLEDALQQLSSGQSELDANKASALQQLDDAQKTIDANRKQLQDAKVQLDEAKKQIDDGYAQLEAGQAELDANKASALAQIEEGRSLLNTKLSEAQSGISTINSAATQLKEALEQMMIAWPEKEWNAYVSVYESAYEAALREDLTQEPAIDSSAFAAERSALENKVSTIQTEIDLLKKVLKIVSYGDTSILSSLFSNIDNGEEIAAMLEDSDATQAQLDQLSDAVGNIPLMAEGYAQASAGITVMNEQLALLNEQEAEANAQLDAAQKTIDENRKKLDDGLSEYENGYAQYVSGLAQLEAGQKELDEQRSSALAQLEEAQQEINDGLKEVEDGQTELNDGWSEYEEGKAEAEERFADAREKLKELDTASWYVQTRMSLSGYSNVASDADSIEAIGDVFPAVFLIVAILMSLTTITRMVEEERGLIGTYKSLGYTDAEILKKYLVYAGFACAGGSVIGTVMAFVVLPMFLFWVFGVMYVIPEFYVSFIWSYGLLGPVIFLGAILLAVWLACRSALKQTPAILMRPKSPKEGSRVLLEYITPLWKRMSFLNKVTARNLFRYKKRMFMTIFGIAGCMALLLFGFSIRDSVTDLMPRQYEQTFSYDFLAAGQSGQYDTLYEKVHGDQRVSEETGIMITQVNLLYGEEQTLQLMVIPDDTDIRTYLNLVSIHTEENVELKTGSVYVTRNAADVLGFEKGDTVQVRLLDLQSADLVVTDIVENYLSNYIYMSQSTYEMYYEDFALNALMIRASEKCTDHSALAKELKNMKGITSVLCIQELKDQFSEAFQLINYVVYIVIVMSALLAFVVLFTLATTNVSEREREIATIKVLGFFDPEVHAYINKETIILTLIGLVSGIPLGYLFAQTLTWVLTLPSIYLAVSLHPASYAVSAGLVAVFALLVQIFTNHTLDVVDPVTALKSVE